MPPAAKIRCRPPEGEAGTRSTLAPPLTPVPQSTCCRGASCDPQREPSPPPVALEGARRVALRIDVENAAGRSLLSALPDVRETAEGAARSVSPVRHDYRLDEDLW